MAKSYGSRSKGVHIDSKQLDGNFDSLFRDHDRVRELGDQLIRDNDRIDDLIRKIESSNLSKDDKAIEIQKLREHRQLLIDQYQEEVEGARQEIEEDIRDEIERAREGELEARSQAAEIRSTKMEVGSSRALDDAASQSDAKAQEFEEMKRARGRELQERIDMMNRARSQMMRQQASGRW